MSDDTWRAEFADQAIGKITRALGGAAGENDGIASGMGIP